MTGERVCRGFLANQHQGAAKAARLLALAVPLLVLRPSLLASQAQRTGAITGAISVVRVPSVNLRANPSVQASIVGRRVRGDTMSVIVERDDGWARIRSRGLEAWVRTASLQPVPATAPPASRPDTASAPSTIASPGISDNTVDPRLAGRARAQSRRASTIPASRDASRFGIMAGVVTGPYTSLSLNGPAARLYARVPMSEAPVALRADLEASRMSARQLEVGYYRITDVRALMGAEFGVPVNSVVEVSVVGSLGIARQSLAAGVEEFPIERTTWLLAHDVGIGAKLHRMFVLEFHFFSSDGAPLRLLAGVRL
jgi:hypothetical protein